MLNSRLVWKNKREDLIFGLIMYDDPVGTEQIPVQSSVSDVDSDNC